jgi:predicted RNase H-like HicB family nuclease
MPFPPFLLDELLQHRTIQHLHLNLVDRQVPLLIALPLWPHSSGWRLSMLPKPDKHTYRITWSEDDGEYVGLCAEFPSLSWLSQTPEAALKGIRKVVEEIIERGKQR